MLQTTFYPAVNSIVNIERLPDPIKDAINKIGSKLFYKTYYVEKSQYSDVAYHYITLIFRTDVGLNLFGGEEGFELLFNPGSEENTTELPLAINYNLPILQYTNSLNINDLGTPKEYFNLIVRVFQVSEGTLLLSAINSVFNNSITSFVAHFNRNPNYSSFTSLSSSYSGNDDEIISDLIIQLKDQGVDIYLYILEEIIAVENNIPQSLDNLYTVFKDILGDFTFEDLLALFIPKFSVSIQKVELGLAFPRTWLKPIDETGKVIEGDLKSKLIYDAGSLVYNSERGFEFDQENTFSLTPSQIGNTGLIIELERLKLDLREDRNIPQAIADGRAENFKGVYAQKAAITLPKRWFPNQTPDTTARIVGYDIIVGTGGFSGTLVLEAIDPNAKNPKLEKTIGKKGFLLFFTAFDISFKQNKVVESNIRGGLKIPRLKDAKGNDAKIEIYGHFDDEGDFFVSASEKDGLPPFGIKNIVQFYLKSVELGEEEDTFFIGCACDIAFPSPLMQKFLGTQRIQIQRMRFYSDGSFEITGGTIPIPANFTLNLGPVEVAITNISIGSYQQEHNGVMRKYMVFGFDGAINLGSLGFEARGKGMQYYFTIDNNDETGKKPHDEFRIQTIEADIIIPGSASPSTATAIIKGYLSIPQPGESPEYSGRVSIKLPKAKIAGSAEFSLQPRYPAFIVDANIEIPTPIPLVPPVSIGGFRGLLGFRYIAEKEAVGLTSGPEGDTWYDYYTYPKRGINLPKFRGPDKSEKASSGFSIGAGATLVTSDGNLLSARVMFMLSIPSLFVFDGRANILGKALDLDDTDEPPFFAFIAIGDDSLELGAGIDFKLPKRSGRLISLNVGMEAYFPFRNASAWYLNLGTRQKPNEARVFELITMRSYLELSGKGIALGARADFDFNKRFGPARVRAWLYVELGGNISFERPQIGGYLAAGGGAEVRFWIITVGVSFDTVFGAEVPKPFRIFAKVRVCGRIKIGFVKIKKCITVDVKWEKDKAVDTTPVPPLPRELADQNVKGISMLTGEAFDLFQINPKQLKNPPNNNFPVLPMDTYIDMKFLKPVDPRKSEVRSKIDGFTNAPEGIVELIPPQSNSQGHNFRQVEHKYSINDIDIEAWNGSKWVIYSPYKAITIEDKVNVDQLKIGYWQKSGAEYNAIRLLGNNPFSYVQQGEKDWFVPEQVGISSSTLFCENTADYWQRANWRNVRIGRRYPLVGVNPNVNVRAAAASNVTRFFTHQNLTFTIIGNNFIQGGIRPEADYARVSKAYSPKFNFSRGLQFNNSNPLVLKYKNPSRKVAFSVNTGSEGMTFIFYKITTIENSTQVSFDAFDTVYRTARQLAAQEFIYESQGANTISQVKIVPDIANEEQVAILREQIINLEELILDEVLENGVAALDGQEGQLGGLLRELNALEAKSCRRTKVPCTGIGEMEITKDFIVGKKEKDLSPNAGTICHTTLFEARWLSEFSYHTTKDLPDQKAITKEFEAGVATITKAVQPIWRPDTQYRIHFSLSDTVQGKENSYQFYFGFATSGPSGHYPGPNVKFGVYKNPQFKIELEQSDIDRYAHTSLRQYIDYRRSYPNADGNLLRSKPLFYKSEGGNNTIRLFYQRAYTYHMLRPWSKYNAIGGDAITNELQVLIKDPSEDITFLNPPEKTTVTNEIPSTTIEWKPETNALFPIEYQLYNNLAQGDNCMGGTSELIIPKRYTTEVLLKDMKPQKLYTALINSLYKRPGTNKIISNEVHNFIFQTSRYGSFKEQVNSYQLRPSDSTSLIQPKVVKEAVFTIDVAVDKQKLATAYTIVAGNGLSDKKSTDLQNEKLDFFDRVTEGIFELKPLDPAATTEFNFIRNTKTNTIIAILIRNPEPFNDPKIPLAVIDGTKQKENQGFAVLSGNQVDKDYKILYAKDYAQIIIMYKVNNQITINAKSLTMRFNYLLWDGTSYEKQGASVDVEIDVISER